MSNIFDTHAHYDHNKFNDDRHVLVSNLPKNGVSLVLNIGCDLKTSIKSIEIAKKYSHVYSSVGAHPHYAKDLTDDVVKSLIELSKCEKVVAFGEIGLDFFHNFTEPNVQRKWFTELLDVAYSTNLPVIIHSRDANDEVFETIKASKVRKGVVHSYSGDETLAKKYIDMGFHIGIGGVVTFDKTGNLQNVVKSIPLEKILLETDCPYLTPHPNRGKRNDSTMLTYVAEAIAKIRNDSVENICNITTENAKKLFLEV